jgi:hypothetical protein
MDPEDAAVLFGVAGGELLLLSNWALGNSRKPVDRADVAIAASMYGAYGCLGGIAAHYLARGYITSSYVGIMGGIVGALIFLNAQLLLN